MQPCGYDALTLVSAGHENSRKADNLAKRSVRQDACLHPHSREVASNLIKTFLVVDDEKNGVVLVEPFIGEGGGFIS